MKIIFGLLLLSLNVWAGTTTFISGHYFDREAGCHIQVSSNETTGNSRLTIYNKNQVKFFVDFNVAQKKGNISYCKNFRLSASYFPYGNIAAVACAGDKVEITAVTHVNANRNLNIFKFAFFYEGKPTQNLICENLVRQTSI